MALHTEVKRQRMVAPDGDHGNSTEVTYSCDSCLFEAKMEMLYHGVQLMSDSFFNYLLNSINDTTAEQHLQVMGKVVVPVQVDCENCREEIDVKAGITATPVWDRINEDDSSESDEVSNCDVVRINHFQDIKVVDILPTDTEAAVSLKACFYNESDDPEPTWVTFEGSDIERSQKFVPDVAKQKTLIIVAKMPYKIGISYLGYDLVEKTILRLVFQVKGAKFSLLTSENLSIGERYKFTMLRHPKHHRSSASPTLLPHKNDDIIVDTDLRHLSYPEPVDLFELLQPLSRCTVEDIFSPGQINERKYIWMKKNCPSVGVLLCKDFNVQLYSDDSDGRRAQIYLNDCWDFPVTGFECEKIKDKGRDILVILSLSSAWDNAGVFKPARCYITCLGIIHKQIK